MKREKGLEKYSTKERQWVKEVIKQWHDKVHPDYVFLTETRGTLYGWVFKEAWKKAYPDEKSPIFYRIDPMAWYNPKIGGVPVEAMGGIEKYFKRRIKKDNAQIVIFDEHGSPLNAPWTIPTKDIDFKKERMGQSGQSSLNIARDLIRWAYEGGPVIESNHNLEDYPNLKPLKYKLGKIYSTGGALRTMEFGRKGEIKKEIDIMDRENSSPTSKLFGKSRIRSTGPTEDESRIDKEIDLYKSYREGNFSLAGAIVKHPEQRKRAQEYVKELKKIGREAGEELRLESVSGKGLERTLGIILISGFLFSALFLSSNITGNTIGNLTSLTSNIIGAVLICVSLMVGLYYLKSKRR